MRREFALVALLRSTLDSLSDLDQALRSAAPGTMSLEKYERLEKIGEGLSLSLSLLAPKPASTSAHNTRRSTWLFPPLDNS